MKRTIVFFAILALSTGIAVAQDEQYEVNIQPSPVSAVLPLLPAKQRQLDKNDWMERDVLVACPDPEERLIMRIDRIKRKTMDSDELT